MEAQRIRGTPYQPRTAPGAQPPAPPAAHAAAPDENPPRLWHFTHALPELPATLSLVVNARTEYDARGAAYLLAEDFCQRIIGQIKANPE